MDKMNEMVVLNVGDLVKGTVIKIEDERVLVDVGYKTEGIVPVNELSNLHVEKPTDVVEEGQELQLRVQKVDDEEVILSKKGAITEQAWADLEEKYENETVFETEVKEVVKGGLVVDVGVRGFIPASLVETYFVDDFSGYKNKMLEVKVTELNREQNRVILSHRAIAEAEANLKKEEVLENLETGQVIEGVVQRLTNFGAFVDIGGVDGLVHVSELAHEHVENPSDIVTEGEKIKVEVLSVDRENERISLSRKKLLPGPWAEVSEKMSAGDTVEGTIRRLVNFGAFVEVYPGVEGLVHISEIANRHIGNPEEVLEEGQVINVKVLSIDEKAERMSLSIKALEDDQEAADLKEYEKENDQSGFQIADLIGDKLDKFK